jgi:hypothetical protein
MFFDAPGGFEAALAPLPENAFAATGATADVNPGVEGIRRAGSASDTTFSVPALSLC